MGCLTRGNHHNHLFCPRDSRQSITCTRTVYLLASPEHHSVLVCRDYWLRIPLVLHPKGSEGPLDIPHPPDPLPTGSGERLFFARFALRLRQSGAYRLPYLHPRQILQASSRHASPPDDLPQEVPAV